MSGSSSQDNSQDFRDPWGGRAKVSLSNRGETYVLSKDSSVGVDRVSVSFEVYDFDKNQSNWDAYTQKHSQQKSESGVLVEEYSRFVDVGPGVQAFVGMTVRHVQSVLASQFGKIEFNPARVADPGGYGLATVDDSIG